MQPPITAGRRSSQQAPFFGAGRRERAMTAAIEAFFAAGWFGWGQGAPLQGTVVPLIVGAIASVTVAVWGSVRVATTSRLARTGAARGVARRYRSILGLELAIAGIGAGVLAGSGHGKWVSVWVGLVVGVHFIPLSRLFRNRSMFVLAIAVTIAAVAALVIGLSSNIEPSAITGLSVGAILLACAAATLGSHGRKERAED